MEEKKIIVNLNSLFFDSSNRPKKTPIHESVILRKFEDLYSSGQIRYALENLQRKRKLTSKIMKTKYTGKVKFYYPYKLNMDKTSKNKISEKIKRLCYWIERYSNPKITSMLGKHLHYLVKSELKIQGFDIIDEGNVKSYDGIMWPDSDHGLDMIAKHNEKNLVIGVEVKNTLDLITYKEIQTKIEMCKRFGIVPIFACRWLGPNKEEIHLNNGFIWEFKIQMYPLGQERFVKEIQKRFDFPIHVRTELPQDSIKNFEKWLKSH